MTEQFKSHPYEYINEANFELIKESLRIGLSTGQTPQKIADTMHRSTGLPLPVTMAIVQAELLDSMKSIKEKSNADRAPEQ